MLKLPTAWSTVQHWLQNTSTCWRIVATCQSVVSHFRSVFSDELMKEDIYDIAYRMMAQVQQNKQILDNLIFDFS